MLFIVEVKHNHINVTIFYYQQGKVQDLYHRTYYAFWLRRSLWDLKFPAHGLNPGSQQWKSQSPNHCTASELKFFTWELKSLDYLTPVYFSDNVYFLDNDISRKCNSSQLHNMPFKMISCTSFSSGCWGLSEGKTKKTTECRYWNILMQSWWSLYSLPLLMWQVNYIHICLNNL